MIDKKLFVEIPGGNNNFHSAVLTTYSINIHHFEYQVLKLLKRKWVSSINVLADQRMLGEVLGVVSGNVKSLSRYYTLSGVKSKGAFHPKINFLVGDTKLLVFFGSGNITPSGHGKNHELFTGFYADHLESAQLPLLKETWQYLLKLSNNLEGFVKNRISKTVPSACSLLKSEQIEKHQFIELDNEIEVALVYNDDTSIFNQLETLIPNEQVEEINIICPYYDFDGATLINLQQLFNGAQLNAFIQSDYGLPPTGIKSQNKISFYNWEETERGNKKISNKVDFRRQLHGKIFHFKANEIEYCMIGSANATIHAIGSANQKPINEEFGCLYKYKGNGFLKMFGINVPNSTVCIDDYKRNTFNLSKEEKLPTQKLMFQIKAADLYYSKLMIYFESSYPNINGSVVIFDMMGIRIFEVPIANFNEKTLNVSLTNDILIKNPGFIIVEDSSFNLISNKQVINWIVELENTDPTKSNRSLNRILGNIENLTFNEFEIIEYINSLQSNKVAFNSSRIQVEGNIENTNSEDADFNTSELSYEEAVLISNQKKNESQFLGSHSSTRLWECLSYIFKNYSASVDEELMDEEEEGRAEISRERKQDTLFSNIVYVKSQTEWSKKYKNLKKFSENYINALKKLNSKMDYELKLIDFHQFLLTTHLLNHLGALTKFEFAEEINSVNENIGALYNQEMLEILTEFAKLCFRSQAVISNSNDSLLVEKWSFTKENVIGNAIFYMYLLDRIVGEKIIKDKIKIIGLNLLKYLGTPGPKFEEFIKIIFNNYKNRYFNPLMVIKFKDSLMNLFNNNPGNDFILIQHSGICKVLKADGKSIKYQSLFNVNEMNNSEKKYSKRLF